MWGWRSDSDDRMDRIEKAKTMAQRVEYRNRNNLRLVEQVAGIKIKEANSYEGGKHSSGQVNGGGRGRQEREIEMVG